MEGNGVVEEAPKPSEPLVAKEKETEKVTKRTREDKSTKKKDDKSLDYVLKSFNSLPSAEEKFAALCKKYSEVFDEYKKHQLSVKIADKKMISLQREKEQLQGEQSKSVLTRSRLENLCRELQRQNKAMKEESLLRIREEEEKRKEVSAKFNSTLADITSLMQQNTESNSKLRDENLDMQSKFKSICDQYKLSEQQVEKINKQMKLETQLAEAKLRKAKLEMLAEKEILERDKQQLMAEVALCQAKLIDHEKTEEALRAQINVYFEKYDEFQNVLTKSNQVYSGFKGEMEKMAKKITRLEKETSTWKQKWEGSHKALLLLASEKQAKDAKVELQARQLAQLQKLCRTLQNDRASLMAHLKAEGITPNLKEVPSSASTKDLDLCSNLTDVESQSKDTQGTKKKSKHGKGEVAQQAIADTTNIPQVSTENSPLTPDISALDGIQQSSTEDQVSELERLENLKQQLLTEALATEIKKQILATEENQQLPKEWINVLTTELEKQQPSADTKAPELIEEKINSKSEQSSNDDNSSTIKTNEEVNSSLSSPGKTSEEVINVAQPVKNSLEGGEPSVKLEEKPQIPKENHPMPQVIQPVENSHEKVSEGKTSVKSEEKPQIPNHPLPQDDKLPQVAKTVENPQAQPVDKPPIEQTVQPLLTEPVESIIVLPVPDSIESPQTPVAPPSSSVDERTPPSKSGPDALSEKPVSSPPGKPITNGAPGEQKKGKDGRRKKK